MDLFNPRSFIYLSTLHVVSSEDICMVHLHFEMTSTVNLFMCFFENELCVNCTGSEKAKGGHDSFVREHTQAHG